MVAKQALPGVCQSINQSSVVEGYSLFSFVSPLGAIYPPYPLRCCPVELSADEISSALQLPVLH
jgi:hypothetical protein